MATRGYMTIRNDEAKDYNGDVHYVEAYHDGYPSVMVKDIVDIPKTLVELIRLGHGHSYMSLMEYRRNEGNEIFTYMYNDLNTFMNWMQDLIPMWTSAGHFICLINTTTPFKYMPGIVGETRYGHVMTVQDFTDVEVTVCGDRIQHYEVTCEHMDDDHWESLVEDTNALYTHPSAKVTLTEVDGVKKLTIPIHWMIGDLLVNNIPIPGRFEKMKVHD